MTCLSNRTRLGLLTMVLLTGLCACGGGDSSPAPFMAVDAGGASTVDANSLGTVLRTYAMQPVSTAEAQGLSFMREEEQLAHDVYASIALQWSAWPIFASIAGSEATHSAAIKTLLDRYGLVDPLAGRASGTFASPAFQTLFTSLVNASTVSLLQALKVGVQIEELDIRDIEVQKLSADNADILLVYDNLLRGSRNHLRSYMKVLTQQGGTYIPQWISQAQFDAIVNSPIETGP